MTTWLLRDEFTTDRAAGAVNGTAAEPGPGTRTVVDTESKLTIGSNAVLFASGKTVAAWGDPAIWYGSLSRLAGRIMVTRMPIKSGLSAFGFDTSASGSPSDEAFCLSSTSITWGTGIQLILGTGSINTLYRFAILQRAVGAFFLVCGGTQYPQWSLIHISNYFSSATTFPTIQSYSATTNAEFIRIPDELWLPTPLISDGFGTAFGTSDGLGHAEGIAGGIGAGGSGVAWTGSTWSVSGGKAVNTPTLGADVVVNGGMESGSPPSSWTANAGSTLSQATDARPGSSGTKCLQIARGTVAHSAFQTLTTVVGSWYSGSAWLKNIDAATGWAHPASSGLAFSPVVSSTDWTLQSGTYRAGTTAEIFRLNIETNSATTFRFDDISVKSLVLSTLFASVATTTADVNVGVNIVFTSGTTQAGVVLNLDSTSSPANFVLAYHGGTNVYLVKCVAGTYTTLISIAATYVAGARLVVWKSGTKYRLYYNNVFIGTEQTISDAGIISNTRHGLFSTSAGNTLDDFVVYATGTGGEYSTLDNYGFDVEGVATVADGADVVSSGGVVADRPASHLPYYGKHGYVRCG